MSSAISRVRRLPRGRCLASAVTATALAAAGLVAATAAPAQAAISCSQGDVCVYDAAGYGTLIAAWPAGVNVRQNLLSAGRDRVSSWRNTGGVTWCAYDQRTLLPDTLLFRLYWGSASTYVGDSVNDRADYFVSC